MRGVIGIYVHHIGTGHSQRAAALARAWGGPVTGLSSLSRPRGWPGGWIQLPRDEERPRAHPDATANGTLHWAPLGSRGLSERMTVLSEWLTWTAPRALIVDVSVEVALLARLHGVPVLAVVLPGDRSDAAHVLGLRSATGLIAAWPPEATPAIVDTVSDVHARIQAIGAISRFSGRIEERAVTPVPRRVTLLDGTGGDAFPLDAVRRVAASTPEWTWHHIGGASGTWIDDPWSLLRSSAVIVTHAGQNAIADVAAARRPAIVIPRVRPHDEQVATARVLDDGPWPAVVRAELPGEEWTRLLEQTAGLDGDLWRTWNDGLGARRAVDVLTALVSRVEAS